FTNIDFWLGEDGLITNDENSSPVDSDQIRSRNDICHVSCELTRACHDSFFNSSRLPMHPSTCQDLSIIRHIVRVRTADNKSAAPVVRLGKSKSKIEFIGSGI
ncbi:unnamed protein product, partial [Onchocerca flexuosa]|uniref:Uncharacterized protein n=2 Tax=Onchocerca flexuosa TaxID=387005 RepID=A0A183HFN5_9BILA